MARQLNLDRDKLDQCYSMAARIISHAAKYIDRHSSPAVERATLLLLGVEGEHRGIPFATRMVESLSKDQLRLGAAYWWGRALAGLKKEPAWVAEQLARGRILWKDLPEVPPGVVRKEGAKLMKKTAGFASVVHPQALGGAMPKLAVCAMDGKPKRLNVSALEQRKKGSDMVLLHCPLKRNYEETFLTEELALAWRNLKEVPAVPVLQGLSLPEQVVLAKKLHFSIVMPTGFTDALTGAVEAKRALVDLSFALHLAARESLWLLSDPMFLDDPSLESLKPHQLWICLLLFEQLAVRQKFSLEHLILSGFPSASPLEKDLATLMSEAQVLREMFPQSFLWYRLRNYPDPLSFLVALLTEQDIIEVDPSQLDAARNWVKSGEDLSRELSMNTYGRIGRQAHQVLEQTWKLLKQMESMTLWKALESNFLKIRSNGAKNLGGEGVFQKSYHYWNPVCQESVSS